MKKTFLNDDFRLNMEVCYFIQSTNGIYPFNELDVDTSMWENIVAEAEARKSKEVICNLKD